jgi:hypothetical protein
VLRYHLDEHVDHPIAAFLFNLRPMSVNKLHYRRIQDEAIRPPDGETWPISKLCRELRYYGFRILHREDDGSGVTMAFGDDILVAFAHLDRNYLEWMKYWVSKAGRKAGYGLYYLDVIQRICTRLEIGICGYVKTLPDDINAAAFTPQFWKDGNGQLCDPNHRDERRDRAWRRKLLNEGWQHLYPNDHDKDMREWKLYWPKKGK